MGETTHISWCDATLSVQEAPPLSLAKVADAARLEVLKLVTRVAERQAVRHAQSQLGMTSVALDMMSSKIAALRGSARLAGEVVASEHRQPPVAVFGATAVDQISRRRTPREVEAPRG